MIQPQGSRAWSFASARRSSERRVAACALFVTAWSWSHAEAQTQGTSDPSSKTTAPAVTLKRSVTFSLSRQAGVTKQTTVTLDGSVVRLGPAWKSMLFVETIYGRVTFEGNEQTVADSQTLRLLLERNLTPRTFLLFQPAFLRNEVQDIDYYVEALAGYGVRIVHSDNGRFNLNLVGVGGAVSQDKNVPEVDGASATVGVLQYADAVLARDAKGEPTWSWNQMLLLLRDLQSRVDTRLNLKTTLTGRVKGPVSLSVSYRIKHEAIVRAGNEEQDQLLSVGVAWNF
jgi:Protein of unknown function, DUF481